MKKLLSILIAFSFIGGIYGICAMEAIAAPKKKQYTIYDRQVELRKKVEKGMKANELTLKEATKLNDELDDIANDIEKAKAKNAGKLSYKDEGKMEKRLNKVSVSLTKYQLTKRVVVH